MELSSGVTFQLKFQEIFLTIVLNSLPNLYTNNTLPFRPVHYYFAHSLFSMYLCCVYLPELIFVFKMAYICNRNLHSFTILLRMICSVFIFLSYFTYLCRSLYIILSKGLAPSLPSYIFLCEIFFLQLYTGACMCACNDPCVPCVGLYNIL